MKIQDYPKKLRLKDFYSVNELAQILHVSTSTARKIVAQGQVESEPVPGTRRIRLRFASILAAFGNSIYDRLESPDISSIVS